MAVRVFLLAGVLAAVPAGADILQLKDGRIIDGKKLERVEGGVKVHFQNGVVFVPERLILDAFIEGEGSSYEPKNPAEAARLAKGLVPYRGKWISRDRYERLIRKAVAEKKARFEEAKKRQKWVNRYKTETAHFRFEYTIPPELAQEYMDLFETYYKVFTRAWGIRPPRGWGKLKVCFYHDEDYFQQVSGAGPGVLGYFRFVEPIELNVYNIRNDKEMTIRVIFHEVNHYLVHLVNPKYHYSPWINEGLAEYYGSSKWDPKKKKMTVGLIQEGRLVSLKDDIDKGEWLTLEELINMRSASLKHYTWGWSFCHFLLHTPKYQKRFKRYFKALGTGRGVKRVPYQAGLTRTEPEEEIRLLKKYLGVKKLKDLEKEWHAYVKNRLKVQSPRGYYEAGRLAERNGLRLKAAAFYKKAIDMGIRNPRCYFAYGRLLYLRDKNEEAIAAFRKALEFDPLDPYVYMYMGLAYRDKGGKDARKKAEQYQRLALEIDPYDTGLRWLAEVGPRRRGRNP